VALAALALEEAELDFLQSLVRCLGLPQKKAEVFVKMALSFLRHQLSIFSEFGRIIVVILLCVRRFSFALVGARIQVGVLLLLVRRTIT